MISNWCGITARATTIQRLYFFRIFKWIYKTAENLERIFKKMVKNYLPSIPITVPGSSLVFRKDSQAPAGARNDARFRITSFRRRRTKMR